MTTLSIKEIKQQFVENNGKIKATVDYDFYTAIENSFEEIRYFCVMEALGWYVYDKTTYDPETFDYEIYDVDITGSFTFKIEFVLKDDNNVLSSIDRKSVV